MVHLGVTAKRRKEEGGIGRSPAAILSRGLYEPVGKLERHPPEARRHGNHRSRRRRR